MALVERVGMIGLEQQNQGALAEHLQAFLPEADDEQDDRGGMREKKGYANFASAFPSPLILLLVTELLR